MTNGIRTDSAWSPFASIEIPPRHVTKQLEHLVQDQVDDLTVGAAPLALEQTR